MKNERKDLKFRAHMAKELDAYLYEEVGGREKLATLNQEESRAIFNKMIAANLILLELTIGLRLALIANGADGKKLDESIRKFTEETNRNFIEKVGEQIRESFRARIGG